jgi:SAM-dependent methyltransferase
MLMFLSLGSHPPANAFLSADQLGQPEPSWPLNTHVCLNCGLIQVPNVIPPGFFRNYLYVPSASDTMHEHFAELARVVAERMVAPGDGVVVDIGCNDGLFLGECKAIGLRTLGIDPATNLIAMARSKGIEVINEYFNTLTAEHARAAHGPARVIVTTNTFNHIDDLHDFMAGVAILLDDAGIFVVEVPHALDLVEKNEFDTVYHEHVSEFCVKSFVELYRFFGMEVFDIQQLSIHGGSMRIFGRRTSPSHSVAASTVEDWLARERRAALFSPKTYEAFRVRVERNRDALMEILRDLKRQGRRLAGYGAPAKGNTLLNYYGIGPDLLEFLADRSALKHGLYSPGMHIPIAPAERVLEAQPDYVLILAWNFADEVMRQQDTYRRRGGKFILPIPEPAIVS